MLSSNNMAGNSVRRVLPDVLPPIILAAPPVSDRFQCKVMSKFCAFEPPFVRFIT